MNTKERDWSKIKSTGPKEIIIYLIPSHLGTGPKLPVIVFLFIETRDWAQSTEKLLIW